MSVLIPSYDGLLDDVHITALVGEIWGIPLTDEAATVVNAGGIYGATLPISWKTQRDAAYNAILDRKDVPNFEAIVIGLIDQWNALPPSGDVETVREMEGVKTTQRVKVSSARRSLRDRLATMYGMLIEGMQQGGSGSRVAGR